MIMPWGKFQGEDIEDIPSDYLRWLAENCDDDLIATEADEEYNIREESNAHFWQEWD
jgi:hypothetical protein